MLLVQTRANLPITSQHLVPYALVGKTYHDMFHINLLILNNNPSSYNIFLTHSWVKGPFHIESRLVWCCSWQKKHFQGVGVQADERLVRKPRLQIHFPGPASHVSKGLRTVAGSEGPRKPGARPTDFNLLGFSMHLHTYAMKCTCIRMQ